MADLSKICNYLEKSDLTGINMFHYLDFGSIPVSPRVKSRKRRIKINDILEEKDDPNDDMVEDYLELPYEQEFTIGYKSVGPLTSYKYRGMLDLYDFVIRKLDHLTTPSESKQISDERKIMTLIYDISLEISHSSRLGPATSVIVGYSIASRIHPFLGGGLPLEIIISTLIDKNKIIVCRGSEKEVGIGLNVVRDNSRYFMFTTPGDSWKNLIKSIIIQ